MDLLLASKAQTKRTHNNLFFPDVSFDQDQDIVGLYTTYIGLDKARVGRSSQINSIA